MIGIIGLRAVVGICPCGVDDPDDEIGQPCCYGFFEKFFLVGKGFGKDSEDKEEAQDFETEEVFCGE